MSIYIKRYLEEIIIQASKTFKILYVSGPRQVGKTTLLKHLSAKKSFNYISLDDINIRNLAQTDPELFLQKYPSPLFIDEAQYAPELFPYLKLKVDQKKQNGQYWLSGSQHFSLIKNIQESLAGRVALLNLLGLSLGEIYQLKRNKEPFIPHDNLQPKINLDINEVFQHILKGSFPVLWTKNSPDRELFFNSYLQTYLERDLKEMFQIEKISLFYKFLQLCAARTGQILNYSDLANNCEISVSTAKKWISILETSWQIYLLKPYYNNFSKRLIKTPKLYFLDTGLAAYLSRWTNAEVLLNGSMAGNFFENFVVSEIIKSYLFRGKNPPLYYFRDKEKHEVDILLEKDQILYPLEIKMTAMTQKKHFSHIEYLRKKLPNLGPGTLLSLYHTTLPFNKNNQVIPAYFIS